jgi:alpha-amylase
MASICFYFQVHQPRRLRRYSVFDTGHDYFDDDRNKQILLKVAGKCYLPTTQLIYDMIQRYEGRFRVSYAITGCVMEQLKQWCPQMIDLLQKLAATGCVEFVNETYYHSLSFLYSHDEFRAQVQLHKQMLNDLFDYEPRIFRNTELIYNNELANFIAATGEYDGILAEGADHILDYR